MSQRDMQHQAAVDGGALATDGYSPAGKAPPPATRLLDLLPALLDDIACRVMQLGARSLLPLTCHAFSLAHLLHAPALRIQLGRQCCDQLLTPRVVAALQARKSKLVLNLEQPATEDARDREQYRKQLAPTLQLPQTDLTALTLEGLNVPSDALASLLSHPPLALQLQQLHLTNIGLMVGDAPGGVGTLLQGLQLKQLSLHAFGTLQQLTPLPETLPSFQPLAQHLTQLHFLTFYPQYCVIYEQYLEQYLVEYLQPLAQLQVLTLICRYQVEGLIELLQVLPQIHTLQLPLVTVRGQQQLDALLAATQLTSLQLATVEALDTSYADRPCSWQRLELTGWVRWKVLAYLPLHSLSQPLVLGLVKVSVEDPEWAAAFPLVALACKLEIKELLLRLVPGPGTKPITPALLKQQRADLAQLVALLQPLQFCGGVLVRDLHEVTATDVLALASLCRDCTHFELRYGSMEPSLEFWRQLVQLMPAVRHKGMCFCS
ncbi:hypothetical protein QJQ45_010950 [Haematococcus lacustris]|nr:hypothetical protein QJQ45_010950 [Haematococcus lacustris]